MSPSCFHDRRWLLLSRTLRAGLIGGLCLGLSGCGESSTPRVATFPVDFSITFKGKPAPGAFMTLHPESPQSETVPTPRGNVGKDGNVRITTYDAGDGAPPGSYVLTVEWYKPVKSGGDVIAGPNVIPAKFASPNTSDLRIEITEGENRLPPIKL